MNLPTQNDWQEYYRLLGEWIERQNELEGGPGSNPTDPPPRPPGTES